MLFLTFEEDIEDNHINILDEMGNKIGFINQYDEDEDCFLEEGFYTRTNLLKIAEEIKKNQ
jgi:hypothetical protein